MQVLKDSLETNGFYGAVLAQASTGLIIAGEHRWRAAKAEGLIEIPVVFIECDDEERRRMLIVDNRASDLGDHQDVRLDRMLAELAASRKGLAGTGFGAANLKPTSEREGDPKFSTIKSWDATGLRLNAIFSFSAPVELQAEIRAVLTREFPKVSFFEHVTDFSGKTE